MQPRSASAEPTVAYEDGALIWSKPRTSALRSGRPRSIFSMDKKTVLGPHYKEEPWKLGIFRPRSTLGSSGDGSGGFDLGSPRFAPSRPHTSFDLRIPTPTRRDDDDLPVSGFTLIENEKVDGLVARLHGPPGLDNDDFLDFSLEQGGDFALMSSLESTSGSHYHGHHHHNRRKMSFGETYHSIAQALDEKYSTLRGTPGHTSPTRPLRDTSHSHDSKEKEREKEKEKDGGGGGHVQVLTSAAFHSGGDEGRQRRLNAKELSMLSRVEKGGIAGSVERKLDLYRRNMEKKAELKKRVAKYQQIQKEKIRDAFFATGEYRNRVVENKKGAAGLREEVRLARLKYEAERRDANISRARERKKELAEQKEKEREAEWHEKEEKEEEREALRQYHRQRGKAQQRQRRLLEIVTVGSRFRLMVGMLKAYREEREYQDQLARCSIVIQRRARAWLSRNRERRLAKIRNTIKRSLFACFVNFSIRRKRKSVTILRAFLAESKQTDVVLTAIRRFRHKVVSLQRFYRARQSMREAQIRVLLLQWDKLEPHALGYAGDGHGGHGGGGRLKKDKKGGKKNGTLQRGRAKTTAGGEGGLHAGGDSVDENGRPRHSSSNLPAGSASGGGKGKKKKNTLHRGAPKHRFDSLFTDEEKTAILKENLELRRTHFREKLQAWVDNLEVEDRQHVQEDVRLSLDLGVDIGEAIKIRRMRTRPYFYVLLHDSKMMKLIVKCAQFKKKGEHLVYKGRINARFHEGGTPNYSSEEED
eukprot:CAMPEP_0113896588 /NCGR_PEP_ID=MMETSP0780_2-20120614/18126_1 /TAXON_ID=652834 /ORGANISM="Palpitomonas bilix" /LENGTH=756 /DNA_ID=CAMNT_0000887795 /DNA_START=233 /DNA_END=2503 /DNA_ORIENTATION=- /assembly_acc=CAM_ASM_000599